MANPNAVAPFHDPYDDHISIIHQTLVPDEDPGIRAIADIPCTAEPNTNNPLLPQCEESTRNVKQFLVQYCTERKQAGFIMLQDPLLIFYEALCVGCNSVDNMAIDDLLRLSPVGSGACQRNQLEAISTEPESLTQHEAEHVTRRSTRSSLAAQHLLVNLVTDQLLRFYRELLFFFSFGNKDMASAQTLVCVKQVKQEVQGEWDESMPLPGDIIEGVAKDAADELFIPAKARSELSPQLGRISRSQEAIWMKVRRGDSAIKLRVCVVPDLSSKLQKRFTIRAASRDRHVAVLADLTFEQCTELQVYEARVHFDNQGNKKWMSLQFYRMLIGGISIGHAEMSRRMVNVDSKGFNQKGVKYDWKMKLGTYLPDQRSTVVNSVLFMPLANEHAMDATTVRTMAWFNAAVSSGIPLVFVNIQTEQIITSEKANSTGKEIIWGRQPNFTTTVQIVQGIRLWFLPGIAEISLELIPVAGEARFGMDIKLTDESYGSKVKFSQKTQAGFICVYSVTKRTAAERAGLGHLFEQANKTGHLLVISRLEGKSLMPSTVSSAGLIHCCDHADIKETLISAMDQMDSIQLNIMSWPSKAPPNSVQAIGAATLRPPS
ncbi:hypothetical protein RJ639_000654 [Escallonia herrerae]|uniref:Uncharacterized protein n=1 Tax=Escallonia herrerae TaxID=1293975 RepID=A0AA89BGR0_9ASTE|nr:hypothetical protein RJ639_000654 [Escallonia herrerae]